MSTVENNAWILLATIKGADNAKNRYYWNGYMAQFLSEEQIGEYNNRGSNKNNQIPSLKTPELQEIHAALSKTEPSLDDITAHGYLRMNFENVTISDLIDFSGFIFPSAVRFDNCHFVHDAYFNESWFVRGCSFLSTRFSQAVFFESAHFGHDEESETFFDACVFNEVSFDSLISIGKLCFSNNEINNIFHMENANCKGHTFFTEAVFMGTAQFQKSIFEKDLVFTKSTFLGGAFFNNISIKGTGYFSYAKFTQYVLFDDSCVTDLNFSEARFCNLASFQKCQFEGKLSFLGASFLAKSDFFKSEFDGAVTFDKSAFHDGAPNLSAAKFNGSVSWIDSLFNWPEDWTDFEKAKERSALMLISSQMKKIHNIYESQYFTKLSDSV